MKLKLIALLIILLVFSFGCTKETEIKNDGKCQDVNNPIPAYESVFSNNYFSWKGTLNNLDNHIPSALSYDTPEKMIYLQGMPGQIIKYNFTLTKTNFTKDDLDIWIEKKELKYASGEYIDLIIDDQGSQSINSAQNWIILPKTAGDLTVPSSLYITRFEDKNQLSVPIMIGVPKNVLPGEYFFILQISINTPDSAVGGRASEERDILFVINIGNQTSERKFDYNINSILATTSGTTISILVNNTDSRFLELGGNITILSEKCNVTYDVYVNEGGNFHRRHRLYDPLIVLPKSEANLEWTLYPRLDANKNYTLIMALSSGNTTIVKEMSFISMSFK